ncbi:CTP synthase [Babesia ovis]|uniref:CTP synthase n=1 Tax=Babesia ovis TaxID=5869 RepID=A0A9W5WVD0_BABOV|nr:CTP synthase [Babesia ovis]
MGYSDDAIVTESNLRFYYEKLCPVRDLVRWLSYEGEKPVGILPRREISFTFQRDTGGDASEFYMRWQSFEGHQQLQNALSGRDSVPYKMDIGAIYNKPVTLMQLSGIDFHAVERELVFDIDMNDYDDLRTCCTDKRICHKCWRFISIAAEILTRSLTEDFGFSEILWVYSGRRGIHGWVCDSKARSLPSEARSAIVDYLMLLSADSHKKRVNLFGVEDHPSVNRAFDICYRNFYDLLQDQNFLTSATHIHSSLEYITDRFPKARQVLQNALKDKVTSSIELFNSLCNELDVETPAEYRKKGHGPPGRHDAFPAAFKELVLAFSYPRLDAAVTKDIGHLLKAPFCIHAKTGRVCVPLEPEQIANFRPEDVPTLRDLQSSPLSPYTRFFRERFLQKCLLNGAKVIGGTMSGVGKGTVMSSLGVLLRSYNISCTAIKIDPYLNLDAGTMSPHEHGEVYVLEDGGEGDLDLGNYERFLNLRLTRDHSITTGKIFTSVFEKERRGCYLGKTVQMVPHVVDEIINWISSVSEKQVDRMGWRKPELCLLEIGGTVGDIESEIFMEAVRQLKLRFGSDNVCLAHLSYIPVVGSSNEQKSKPTQHSVKNLQARGIQPDMIFGRCATELLVGVREKIAFFTQVKPENVISVHNSSDVYNVPLILDKQEVAQKILKHLNLTPKQDPPLPKLYTLTSWGRLVQKRSGTVTVALVGKYNAANDAYLSVMNALKHSAMDAGYSLELIFYESEKLEADPSKVSEALDKVSAVVVPGGFGDRGVRGKMMAIRYCRQHGIPFLGICLGLQLAVLDVVHEFDPDAVHGEMSDAPEEKQAIIAMPEFIGEDVKGGTMRLGVREALVEPGSLAHQIYDHASTIHERYRHRYEVNPIYVSRLKEHGFRFSGQDPSGRRMVMVELPNHPFFFATQFHPEFQSTPFRPSPPFLALVLAAKGQLKARLDANGGKLCPGSKYETD